MRRLVVLALVTACGRVDFDAIARGDAMASADGIDGAVTCSFGPWAPPQPATDLNTGDTDWGPQLSHDKLTLVFASSRGATMDQLFVTTRATEAAAWSAPTPIFTPVVERDDPALSRDGLELYWGTGDAIGYAQRATPQAAWTIGANAPIQTSGFAINGGPDLSPDGLRMLFTATDMVDGKWHEYQTQRLATSVPFSDPATAVPLAHTSDGEAFGSYRGDELEIIFETETTPQQLLAATRAALDQDFGPAQLVAELADPTYGFGDPDLSDDGTTLWFASTRPGGAGGWDLWFTTRACM